MLIEPWRNESHVHTSPAPYQLDHNRASQPCLDDLVHSYLLKTRNNSIPQPTAKMRRRSRLYMQSNAISIQEDTGHPNPTTVTSQASKENTNRLGWVAERPPMRRPARQV